MAQGGLQDLTVHAPHLGQGFRGLEEPLKDRPQRKPYSADVAVEHARRDGHLG